jgi:death-on-curing protein
LIQDITEDIIRAIHAQLENRFPNMLKGVEKDGLISALIQKQNQSLFGSDVLYPDIYLKAAVLMEGLIRWHIFTDGNKRTALVSTFVYLYGNKHYLAIPIDSVRFLIRVADDRRNDQDYTNKLITEISEWLREHSATDEREFFIKAARYNLLPAIKLSLLYFFGFRKKAKKLTDYWYALESHQDYVLEAKETSKLIRDVVDSAILQLYHTLRTKKKTKDL